MFWYGGDSLILVVKFVLTNIGVGISYLIIIGDLMPQIATAFLGAGSDLDFLADRHFWVTFFMSVSWSFAQSLVANTGIGSLLYHYHF